jgi:hypothetical protein
LAEGLGILVQRVVFAGDMVLISSRKSFEKEIDRTLLIRINRDGEPSVYTENPINWILLLK